MRYGHDERLDDDGRITDDQVSEDVDDQVSSDANITDEYIAERQTTNVRILRANSMEQSAICAERQLCSLSVKAFGRRPRIHLFRQVRRLRGVSANSRAAGRSYLYDGPIRQRRM